MNTWLESSLQLTGFVPVLKQNPEPEVSDIQDDLEQPHPPPGGVGVEANSFGSTTFIYFGLVT